jgi:hypothetical protein
VSEPAKAGGRRGDRQAPGIEGRGAESEPADVVGDGEGLVDEGECGPWGDRGPAHPGDLGIREA